MGYQREDNRGIEGIGVRRHRVQLFFLHGVMDGTMVTKSHGSWAVQHCATVLLPHGAWVVQWYCCPMGHGLHNGMDSHGSWIVQWYEVPMGHGLCNGMG